METGLNLDKASGFILGHIGSVQERLGASCFHFTWRNDKPASVLAELTGKRNADQPDTSVLFDYGIGTSDQYEAIYANPALFFERINDDGSRNPPQLKPPVKAVVISHEHIDHVDGLIYAIKQNYILPPIHIGDVARKDLLQKLKEAGVEQNKVDALRFESLKTDGWVKIGALDVRAFPIKHSTIEAFSFVVAAPNKAAVFYMADGKYDPSTLVGQELDVEAVAKACADKGYHMTGLMLESTNGPVNIKGKDQTVEKQVRKRIRKIIEEHAGDDVVVSFWSRNDQRRATVEAVAGETGRPFENCGYAHVVRSRILKGVAKETGRVDLDSKTRARAGYFASSSEKRRKKFHSLQGIRSIIIATGPNAERRSAMVRAASGTGKDQLNPKGKVFIISATILEHNMVAFADMVAGLMAQGAKKIYIPGHSYHESTKRVRKLIIKKLKDRGIDAKKIDEKIFFDAKLHASGHADHSFIFAIQKAFSDAFIFAIHGPYANVVDNIRMLRRKAIEEGYTGRVLDILAAGKFLKIPAPKVFRDKVHIAQPIILGTLPEGYMQGVQIQGRGASAKMRFIDGLGSDGRPVHMAHDESAMVSPFLRQGVITVGRISRSDEHQEISIGPDKGKAKAIIIVDPRFRMTTRLRRGAEPRPAREFA